MKRSKLQVRDGGQVHLVSRGWQKAGPGVYSSLKDSAIMIIREAHIRPYHGLSAGSGVTPAGLPLSLLRLLP